MDALRRWLDRLSESDEARLAAEIREWAGSVPGTVPIAEAPNRIKVKVAGVVKRITVLPAAGHETLKRSFRTARAKPSSSYGAPWHRWVLTRHQGRGRGRPG